MKRSHILFITLTFLGCTLSGCKQPMTPVTETITETTKENIAETTKENVAETKAETITKTTEEAEAETITKPATETVIESNVESMSEETESSSQNQENDSISSQLELIASKKDSWYPEDASIISGYMYAVTDLDQNGQLEIITSVMAGTGLYTTSHFFEVNSTFDDIRLCSTDFIEGDSEPDIMFGVIPVYFDASNQTYHYIVTDIVRNGAAESYHSTHSLTLKDGSIQTEILGRSSSIYNGSETIFSYQDNSGQDITKEEYDSIASQNFPDFQAMEATLFWQSLPDLDALSQEEWISQLEISYQGFAVK